MILKLMQKNKKVWLEKPWRRKVMTDTHLAKVKTCYKATVIKTVWYWYMKSQKKNQWKNSIKVDL